MSLNILFLLSRFVPMLFDMLPSLFSLDTFYFLTAQITLGLLTLCFSCPNLEINQFLKRLCFFCWRMAFGGQDLSTRCVDFDFQCLLVNRTAIYMMYSTPCIYRGTSTPVPLHLKNTIVSLTSILHHQFCS